MTARNTTRLIVVGGAVLLAAVTGCILLAPPTYDPARGDTRPQTRETPYAQVSVGVDRRVETGRNKLSAAILAGVDVRPTGQTIKTEP